MANNVTVNFTSVTHATDPLGIGFVVTEFGGNPVPIVSDSTWNAALKALAPGHCRFSLAYYGGNPSYGAGGSPGQQGSGGSAATALINAVKGIGAIPFVFFNGNSTDNNFVPADGGSLVHFFNDNGGQNGGRIQYWGIGNEPDNTGGTGPYEAGSGTGSATATISAMHAADSTITLSVPSAAYWDTSLVSWAAGQTGVGILSYHAYDGVSNFPNDGEYYTHVQTDLPGYKSGIMYGLEECNWNPSYGSGGATTQFYDWHNCVFMADAAGQVLSAGGHFTMYGDSNQALGLMNDGSGGQGQPGSKYTTFPAYWGLGIWTGMNGQFKRWSSNMVSCTNTIGVSSVGTFACDNGKVVIVNKTTSSIALTIGLTLPGGVTSSTYNIWATQASNPLSPITEVVTGATFTGSTISYTIPASTAISIDVAGVGSSGGGGGSMMPAPPGYGTKIFEDQFTGTSLNTANWVTYLGEQGAVWNNGGLLPLPYSGPNTPGNNNVAVFSSSQVSVNNGVTLTAQTYSGTYSSTYPWISGIISTEGLFSMPTTSAWYVQVKAKMPDMSIGMWPAIWFLPGIGSGASNEIDLFEGGFTGGSGPINNQLHMDFFANQGQQALGPINSGVDLTAGYNIWGMAFVPGVSITGYFNGAQIWQVLASSGITIAAQPYEIIINLQVAGSVASGFHTAYTGSTPTSTMEIAEVQVWTPGGGSGGGGGTGSGTVTQPGGVAADQFLTASEGAYLFQFNEWNTTAAYSCTYSYTTTSAAFAVASSSISVSTSGAPGSYSSIISGNHVVGGGGGYSSSVNNQFPIQISTMTPGLVTTSVAGTVIGTGAWDFAYDIWFSITPSPGNVGNNATGLEMMIWLNQLGAIQPAGSLVATTTINGVSYHVWDPGTGIGPISYVCATLVTSVTNLDLLPFINDAIARGLLTSAWYLIDVECGFEIWTGGTGLAITSFSCTNGTATGTGGGGGGGSIVPLAQNFEEGVAGNVITTANSGGSGSNAFDLVGTSGGGISDFSSQYSPLGSICGVFTTPAAGGTASVSWANSLGTQTQIWGRVYVNLAAYPAFNDAIVLFSSTGSFAGGIQISTSGQILTQDATYANLPSAISSQTIPLNTWVRIEWFLQCGIAGSAELIINYYAVTNSTAITETMTDASGPYGIGSPASINQISFGWNTTHPNQPNMFLDNIAVNITGYPGPSGSTLFLTQDFGEGTNGTTLTAGNTAGVGENAFNSVTITNSAPTVFSNAQAIHSALSGSFSTTATAGTSYVTWTFTAVAQFYGRVYLYLVAHPTTTDANIQIRGTGASTGGNIQISNTGNITIQNIAFSQIHTFTNAIPTGTWVRIEWDMVTGTAGNAVFTVNYYASADSTTVTETFTDNTYAWGGTGGVAEVDFGWTNPHASQPVLYLGPIQVNNYQYPGPIGGNLPTMVTGSATAITATSATLNGTINPNGIASVYAFNYGLTTSYTNTQPSPSVSCGSGNTAVAESTTITGLTPATTYHFQISGGNSNGIALGLDASFTTTTTAPVVATNAATSVTSTGAVLNGTVNPNGQSTTYQFQYGLTTGYGSVSPASPASAGSGSTPIAESTTITGLAANTVYHYRLNATNATGTTNGPDSTLTTASVTVPVFPATPLGILVQILVNGAWTDISDFVYQRNDISISGRGRPDETSQTSPASLTFTLNNVGGTFSPGNPSSPYYPYIQSNTQIRIFVNSQSGNGTAYAGYRFWGEVRKWPPSWDVTGNDSYVSVTAGGLLTRYIQGANIRSPLHRYYDRKTDATAPIAHWTCEELVGATQFMNNTSNNPSIVSGPPMTWTGTPNLSADSACGGCDPIPQLMGSVWTGATGSYTFSGPISFNNPGQYYFIGPGGVTSLSAVHVVGAGGGGANGGNGDAGGGGECAAEVNVPITPGKVYTVNVGKGGDGASGNNTGFLPGGYGGLSYFTADTLTVVGHGGLGASVAGAGTGGTGSTNTTHYNGGNGGTGGANGGGGGGGGGAGPTGAGGNGGNGTAGLGSHGGTGGTAGSGNAAYPAAVGGTGAQSRASISYAGIIPGTPGDTPGGGGGGGAWNATSPVRGPGLPGAPGQVWLNFTTSNTPQNVVVRWVMDIPGSGMPNNAVICRAYIGSGTLAGGYMETYYGTGGKLGQRFYTATSVKVYDSGLFNWGLAGAGPVMATMEMAQVGNYVECTVGYVKPGATTYQAQQAGFTGTLGAVNQIVINPSGKIQDTAVGSIVLQYALESLLSVSPALSGFNGELAADRFFRLCAEEGFKGLVIGSGAWNFNDGGVDGWFGTNGASVSPTQIISSSGTNALLVTVAANGTAGTTAYATSPAGTSGIPVIAGQPVSVYVDVQPLLYAASVFVNLNCYNSSGTLIAAYEGISQPVGSGGPVIGTTNTSPGSFTTVSVIRQQVPTGTSFVGMSVGFANGSSIITQFIIDGASIAIGSAMGPQPDDTFVNVLQQCEDVDRGTIIEARDFFGLKYRTRGSLQNQPVTLSLNYTAAQVAAGLQPVFDESLIRNDIILTRPNGSSWDASLNAGPLSVLMPPNGVGIYQYSLNCNCYTDNQLANIGAWVLTTGTVNDYRYPSMPVDLTRIAVQSLFAAAAIVDCGDFVQITNAPTDRLPNATVNQLAFGLDEDLNAYKWTITMACIPESPYTGSGFPTW